MGIVEILILGVGVSMDAFAVSVCKGLLVGKTNKKGMFLCGIWFGGFQAIMPLIGFFIGSLFSNAIVAVDHWVAFILLSLIGINMLKEAFLEEKDCCDKNTADFSVKTMFTMAIATSIDALAVGVSLAMTGNVNIWAAVLNIGVITFVISSAGVKIGSVFGDRFGKKAQFTGGIILIVLGIKILIEHLSI